MARKNKPFLAPAPPAPVTSLGELLKQRGVPVGSDPPQPPSTSPASPPPADAGDGDLSPCGKIVVRRERKGHGGKTATVIDGLGLPPPRLDALARSMRKAFGCGSRVDGGRVIVQGDRASVVEAWLRQRGARQVVLGN